MAHRATSLGPKPSLFFGFVLFCFIFVFFVLEKKNSFFLNENVFLLIFQCLPLFLPSFFTPISLSLSFYICICIYIYILFFSCFSPSLFSPFFASLCFSYLVSLLVLSGEEQLQNIILERFVHQSFLFFFFFFFRLALSFKYVFLSLRVPYLKLCLCSTSKLLCFTKYKL